MSSPMQWDAFICHASEDKEVFVRLLANQLQKMGLEVWYDEFTLRLGDSLRRKIDDGLNQSTYGIVVLSPSFFGNEWPQKELDGLVAREREGRKVLLPIWHDVGFEEVKAYSPTLADRLAISSSIGIVDVATSIYNVVRGSDSHLSAEAKEDIRVIIRRPPRGFGKANNFVVECDGRSVGLIENGGEIMFKIPTGRHTISVSYAELHHHFLDGKYGPSGGSISRGASGEVVFDFVSGNYLLETGYERTWASWLKSVSPLYVKRTSHFD